MFDEGIFGGVFAKNEHANMMNDNPEIASAWKGRILMHIEAQESKHPERKVDKIDPSIKEKAINKKLFKERIYDIVTEIGMGVSLPSNNKQYKIRVKIGDAYDVTSAFPKEAKPGYNRWSERFEPSENKSVY